MGRKRLATAVLVTGALHSGFASALGLGDLTLDSALNQPFRAEIPLRDVGELDVAEIKIALADDSAFERAGVERSQFLSSLQFQVELQSGGNGRIIVTTAKTVQEPYLDFILEVRWPNGKMNREYTVLLDLPVFAPASPAPTVNVARSAVQSAPVVRPVVVNEVMPVREQGGSIGVASRVAPQARDIDRQQSLPEAADATEYRVQHHDTMWKIADKLRPSSYVTTQQTMLALLKKNPKAFVAGNVNRIKSGYILRIPSEAEVREISHDHAVDEIRAQAVEWRGGKVSRVSPEKKSASTSAKSSSPDPASASAPQLDATDKSGRETPAIEEQAVKFSVGSAGSDTAASNDVDALRQKVREEQENLEKSMLENGAMQARVIEMEKQIRTLQNLITLKNSQLAALQTGLAKGETPSISETRAVGEDNSDLVVASDAEQKAMAPVVDVDSGSEVVITDPLQTESVAEAKAPAVAEVDETVSVIDSVKSSGASLLATAQAWLSNGFVKFIGLGVAVLALLILILRRRGNESDSEADLAAFEASLAGNDAAEQDVFSAERDTFDFDIGNTDATELSDSADEGREQSFNADDFDFDKLDASVDGSDKVMVEEDEGEVSVSSIETEAVQPQTGDIVAEADIYVAYGRYDQAASLLKTAISQDPSNADLQVKLVDIYLDTRDRDNFALAFAGLQSLGDSNAIARVKESMSAIEGVSDWLEDDGDFDLDLAVADEVSPELVDSDLDFELGDDLDFELGEEELASSDTVIDKAVIAEDVAESNAPEATDVHDFAEAALTGAAADELNEDKAEDSGMLAESDAVDESIRSAEADALASLDVDLADLDFDFEPSAAASAENDSGLDNVGDDEPELSELTKAESSSLDSDSVAGVSDLTEDDDFEFDFSAFDEAEETAESSANGSEPDSLPPKASEADSTDDDIDLGLSEFASTSDENEELLSADKDFSFDETDLELDTTTLNADADLSESIDFSADDDLDLNLADFDTPVNPAAATSPPSETSFNAGASSDAESSLDLDDDFFMDAGDGDAVSDNIESESELSGTESAVKPTDGGIAVEDLSFDEFDATEGEEEFDNLLDTESVATKLDLARAYVDMGDSEGAREMLEEVLVEGDIQQQSDAKALLDIIG